MSAKTANYKGLGDLQKDILLWVHANRAPNPPITDLETLIKSRAELVREAEKLKELDDLSVVPTNFKRWMVPWSAERFLGRKPTRSESASLSKAVKALEQRGLIRRHRAGSKTGRTKATSLVLTAHGGGLCYTLWMQKVVELLELDERARSKHDQARKLVEEAQAFEKRALRAHNELKAMARQIEE